jgi:hypothetical protein
MGRSKRFPQHVRQLWWNFKIHRICFWSRFFQGAGQSLNPRRWKLYSFFGQSINPTRSWRLRMIATVSRNEDSQDSVWNRYWKLPSSSYRIRLRRFDRIVWRMDGVIPNGCRLSNSIGWYAEGFVRGIFYYYNWKRTPLVKTVWDPGHPIRVYLQYQQSPGHWRVNVSDCTCKWCCKLLRLLPDYLRVTNKQKNGCNELVCFSQAIITNSQDGGMVPKVMSRDSKSPKELSNGISFGMSPW